MLAKTYAIAHIIASRGMNDDEPPKCDHDPIGAELQEGTRQEVANTFERHFGAERIPLTTSLLGTGAQFDYESTGSRDPVSALIDPYNRRIPELDHMRYEDQQCHQFQTPGGLMQSSQEDFLAAQTLLSISFPLRQHHSTQNSSSPMPNTSIGQCLSPVSTPFASATPTSQPNNGPQDSLPSQTTTIGTGSSLDGSGVCPECGHKVSVAKKEENRNNNVRRHMREHHGQSVKCPQCGKDFSRQSNMRRHITDTH